MFLPHPRVHLLLQHAQFTVATCPVYCCNMPSLLLQHAQFTVATCPVYCCNMPSLLLQHVQFTVATWTVYCCNMPSLLSQYAQFTYVSCQTNFSSRWQLLHFLYVSPTIWTGISPSNLCLPLYKQVSHRATCVSHSRNKYLTQQLVSPTL
jgi:hypothetical protein